MNISTATASPMIVLATACDDQGKTTGLFIVSSPTSIAGDSGSKAVISDSPPLTPLLATVFEKTTQNNTTTANAIASKNGDNGVLLPLLPEKPALKGILKPPKAICYEVLASLPPPIQRSARLTPRELRRLTPSNTPLHSDPGSGYPVLPPKPRPTGIRFAETVSLLPTHATHEYNRGCCDFAARGLTPLLAHAIKKELNEVKREMDVHEESRGNTQFYKV